MIAETEERTELEVLAGRVRRVKAGEETLEFREPVIQFYLEGLSKFTEVFLALYKREPELIDKFMGDSEEGIDPKDMFKLLPVADVLFELFSLMVPEKKPEWFKNNLSLNGLLIVLNAVLEVLNVREVVKHFFTLRENLRKAIPTILTESLILRQKQGPMEQPGEEPVPEGTG